MRYWLVLLTVFPLMAAAEEAGWRLPMHDVHEPAIDHAHARARSAMDQLADDVYGLSDLPAARALLDAETMPRDLEALLGRWRCRSIQIGSLGVFAYPAFRCEIELTEDGTLRFTKTSGSQRRHGQIYPHNDRSWVFLGGQSVNNDPYREYSNTRGDSDGEDLEYDTVGLLETLADGRLRLILDASPGQVEFYELSR